MHQGTKRPGHGRGIHHRQHGNAQPLRQISRAGFAVEQAHHSLNQNQIILLRCMAKPCANIGLTIYPQIQIVHRLSAGQRQPLGIEEIKAALEYLHPPPGPRMQTRQAAGDTGFALPRRRSSNQKSGTGCHWLSALRLPRQAGKEGAPGLVVAQRRFVALVAHVVQAQLQPPVAGQLVLGA